MASSIASARPHLAAPAADLDVANDPFVATASSNAHHRFSAFDHELFAAGPGSSPRQAKRALEAHLAETERRLDEAGKLGTALVSQRKALAEQLQEIEKLQAEGELGPELRQKLVEIEREYNDLARESARAFLPKRIPSNENGPATPYAPDGRTARRSISPSKFDGQATGSPTKLTVPKRRARNQQSNRIHDIEFAAEISTSLIAQVRNLQSLLSEREEEVKTLQGEKSRLEIDTEGLHQRLKTLDESEHRYKDENWNLETRMQEMTALQKEASDKEKKLNQALSLANMEKTTAQKELDEVKASHAKLTEDHAAVIKLHDIELGSARRNLTLGEDERTSLQKKIDDLTSQNQELARAFSTQRGRLTDREPGSGLSDDDFETATDGATPEHSPPPSPVKGTPRHAVLETETVKTSLGHAQRTIQSQRNQLHREKTEKLELRRIIQDLRDDLEKLRNDAGGSIGANRRSRKVDSKEYKRPSKLLGSLRSGKHEIFLDDPEWEENDGVSPPGSPTAARRQTILPSTEPSDQFDTANEASESAFETANERATETEDFQTGHEDMSDSDGAETETESRGFGRMKQTPNLPAGLARHANRESFHSTASTSADEALDTVPDVLSAASPGSVINTNRDSSGWRSSYVTATETDASRPMSTFSYSDMHEKIAQFPIPPNAVAFRDLVFSTIQVQDIEPREAIIVPPTLKMSEIFAQGLEPIAVPERAMPVMSLGQIQSEAIEPIEPPSPTTPKATPVPVAIPAPTPQLSLSTINTQNIVPTFLPQPVLGYSSIATERVSPVSEAAPALPELGFSSVRTEHTMPVSPAKTRPPQLSLSSIASEVIKPKTTPVSLPMLTFSAIQFIDIEPQSPRNERRNGFILPRDLYNTPEKPAPETPNNKLFGALFGRGRSKDASPNIAEDETRQSPSDTPNAETPESQRPFKEISANSYVRPPRKSSLHSTSDQGAQTALTGGAIDRLQKGHRKSPSTASVGSPETMGTVRIHRSQESLASHVNRSADFDDSMYDTGSVIVRPDSAASGKRSAYEAQPPLPANHRQAIQAAGSHTQGNMGPPLWPASAMKRPSTPSQRKRSGSGQNGTPTPRANRTGGFVEFQQQPSVVNRQPSVSSFASDIDARFDMHATGFDNVGFGPNTDPRMIQAITQTMIGEYLWKYTRKTGRGELSANRHRRYFWVHPYTRTLYWGEKDPSNAGRSELKAKSVPIEAVRVVTDDNPMPPGLHRKSLVVIAPGRTIKFTCPTGQRHETWFNALSYLLVRTEPQATYDAEDVAGSITREDVDEFNPQFGRRPVNGNRPEQQSLSSYNSRTIRPYESPAEAYSMTIPTLTPTHRKTLASKASKGTLSKMSGYWKLSSLRSRAGGSNVDLYATNQVHDSAEDLREMIERQDRDADRLENVRACCDGKHDVGNVSHSASKRHRHSHGPMFSPNTTPVSSTRTRA
ncbi:hypothetical protein PWT90_03323 [Aphanocladium album]|nr:hypothetical protein PWT90_03323 [Aphanocladium album]